MSSFISIINEAIKKENEKPHKSSGKWNPSSFGFCYRRQYWKRLGETETNPPDERTLRVFKVGNIFEDWVGSLIVAQNPQIKRQVLVEEEDVKGFADFVNIEEVADTKTMNSSGFHYLRKKDCDIRVEKENNWLQVMYYVKKLLKKSGRLVFISKDDLCIEEYVQPMNQYWEDKLRIELETLRGYWTRKELPKAQPRVYKHKDGSYGECEYCQFSVNGKCKQ